MKNEIHINDCLILTNILQNSYKMIEHYTEQIEDFSRDDSEVHTGTGKNPKESIIVQRADELTRFQNLQNALEEVTATLTARINSLNVRAEIIRATYLYYIQGYSLDDVGGIMNYSKTQANRLRLKGKEEYERIYECD